jgi:hypothetical protein
MRGSTNGLLFKFPGVLFPVCHNDRLFFWVYEMFHLTKSEIDSIILGGKYCPFEQRWTSITQAS